MEHPLDHVAIAVPSIALALPTYELLSGVAGSSPEHVAEQRVNVVFVGGSGCRIELIEPAAEDSPIAKFLARRGPGLHHVAYLVPDIDAALMEAQTAGLRPIDERPRPGAHGRRVAFLHPATTHGVLVELIEAQPSR